MVIEGGSIEVDGRGTLMAKSSSILNKNRNPGWTREDAERYFTRYLGVTNFIWLDGKKGGDITDDHIDGTARFAHGDAIVTFYRKDFEDPREYDILAAAKDVNGKPYRIVSLPVTTKKIAKLNDYGVYTNYYVGNRVLLMPTYNDPSDVIVKQILADFDPEETLLASLTQLYKDGGIHIALRNNDLLLKSERSKKLCHLVTITGTYSPTFSNDKVSFPRLKAFMSSKKLSDLGTSCALSFIVAIAHSASRIPASIMRCACSEGRTTLEKNACHYEAGSSRSSLINHFRAKSFPTGCRMPGPFFLCDQNVARFDKRFG